MPDAQPESEVFNKRIKSRVELSAPGKLSEPFAGNHGVELLDISASGARIATFRNFSVDQTLYLTIDKLQSLKCVVRWVKHGEIGVAFDRDLYPAVVEHIAAAHRARTR
ncbi:PilZ domain-containing protein [Sphingomonas japonica]|uniref:PilZ domain-containing protein n=1 Tax=Sphingomonas japonica TaxID=511662 RepID=A0ABX0U4G1_9SPHN|nr:PilZ domain-containing protein [Sphingomonas japonica]NIJ24940.1 hypothetical protein [Sphingomonas japonica]